MPLGNKNSWHSSSGNQSQTGANQQASPAPNRQLIQNGSGYGYIDFPWTAEPESMSMPVTSTPESTPYLSRTFKMDNKSTCKNWLQKASMSTPTGRNQLVASPHPGLGRENMQGSSRYASLPWAAEPQIPMLATDAQLRPPYQDVSKNIQQCFWPWMIFWWVYYQF